MRALILALIFVACSSRQSGLGLQPVSALQDHAARVVEAVNEAVGAELLFLGGTDAAKVSLTNKECGSSAGKDIYVALSCERFGPDALSVILIHEVGHTLGLQHSDDTKSVMFKQYMIGMSLDAAADSLFDELVHQGPILLPPNEVPL